MKIKNITLIGIKTIVLILLSSNIYAQVGIGTLEPHASAMLDMQSTSKGMLAPRMTSAERKLIAEPANGLLVYDTTENSFYFYKFDVWVKQDASVGTRSNYKLVKSAADLSEELVGSTYVLNTNTLYEINGTVNLSNPIDLNNAYIMGLDSGEDKLMRSSGALFEGSTGGSVKNLTLSAGTVFNLTGASGQNLVLRDLIIVGSGSVGSISGYDMVFKSVIQYILNTTGITYQNINSLLLSNTGWFGNNSGTYETYKGTFGFIEKQGGFMTVNTGKKGIDVSSNPTVTVGVLTGVSFSGGNPTEYVLGYPAAQTYTGYKFSNSWTVDCPGLKVESDEVASANIYYTGEITNHITQNFNNGTAAKINGSGGGYSIAGVNMFRMSSQANKIVYQGKKTRTFQINASLTARGINGNDKNLQTYYSFFLRKNNNDNLMGTRSVMKVHYYDDAVNQSLTGSVVLEPGDFIEMWVQRVGGNPPTNTTLEIISLNLSIR